MQSAFLSFNLFHSEAESTSSRLLGLELGIFEQVLMNIPLSAEFDFANAASAADVMEEIGALVRCGHGILLNKWVER